MRSRIVAFLVRIVAVANRAILTVILCLNLCAASALWLMPDTGRAIMSATSSLFAAFA